MNKLIEQLKDAGQDFAREFVPDMAAGAEKYFDKTLRIGLNSFPQLMCGES